MQTMELPTRREFYFSSPKEVYDTAENILKNNEKIRESYEKDKENFRGADNKTIHKRKYGWPDGVKKILSFPEIDAHPKNIGLKNHWNYYDGFTMDMDRFYDGRPFMCTRKKVIGDKMNAKTMDMYVSIAESMGVKYENLLCRGLAALKIIDALEANGIQVRVCAYIATTRTFYYRKKGIYKGTYLECTIKKYDDPLNLSLLATVLTPWFFRYWIFILLDNEQFVRPTLGSPAPFPYPVDQKIVLQSEECLTLTDVTRKYKEIEKSIIH